MKYSFQLTCACGRSNDFIADINGNDSWRPCSNENCHYMFRFSDLEYDEDTKAVKGKVELKITKIET